MLDTDRTPYAVLDNGEPRWALAGGPDDPGLTEDYAIVSRVFNRETHTPILEVSGLAHFGTEAAADLVTSETLLREALHDAPRGWSQMNLELVLRVRVINGAAAVPEVMATHYW